MINDTVRWLQQMHQPHEFSDELIQPDRFEDDFEREFGVGDEQHERPARIDQEQFDHGCRDGDYA